jgi:hypothetical protein
MAYHASKWEGQPRLADEPSVPVALRTRLEGLRVQKARLIDLLKQVRLCINNIKNTYATGPSGSAADKVAYLNGRLAEVQILLDEAKALHDHLRAELVRVNQRYKASVYEPDFPERDFRGVNGVFEANDQATKVLASMPTGAKDTEKATIELCSKLIKHEQEFGTYADGLPNGFSEMMRVNESLWSKLRATFPTTSIGQDGIHFNGFVLANIQRRILDSVYRGIPLRAARARAVAELVSWSSAGDGRFVPSFDPQESAILNQSK